MTSSDDGTVRLFDACSGRFLRKLISLDSGANGAVVWRICVKNDKLVCAAGSRNYRMFFYGCIFENDFEILSACISTFSCHLLDTQIMVVDFNDREAD